MSPFVSKGMTSCSRDCFFRVNASCFSFFRREGGKASLQRFIFRVRIGTVGEASVGMCCQAAERGAGSLSLESLVVLFVSVTLRGFCFSIKH